MFKTEPLASALGSRLAPEVGYTDEEREREVFVGGCDGGFDIGTKESELQPKADCVTRRRSLITSVKKTKVIKDIKCIVVGTKYRAKRPVES